MRLRPSQGSAKIERPEPAGTMAPAPSSGRSAGLSVMWVPRLGRMTGTSASSWSSSGRMRSAQTPVALITLSARTVKLSPVSASVARTPAARPSSSTSSVTSQPLTQTAPKRSASSSTVRTRRASSVWQS